MYKRVVVLFGAIILIAFCVMGHTLMISLAPQYVEAAGRQSAYNVTVCRSRGMIYDRKLRPLAGGRLQYRAVIVPSRETTVELTRVLTPEKLLEIQDGLTGSYPFVCSVDDAAADGCGASVVFPAQKRYGKNCVAVHTVGYLGGEGQGVSGIERAYDDYLAAASGELSVRFTVDAAGAGLAGIEPQVRDTTGDSKAGVVLTLDVDTQKVAEEAARRYMTKGAVVVMEACSGEIRASVSLPDFEQDDIASAIEAKDSPLVNRSISAFDIGSVFKIVVAAAALESGISADTLHCCQGGIDIGSNRFHCANHSGHGEINMEEAFARSCNIYFIELARHLGGEIILDYAHRFGFGTAYTLADNYVTAAGCLPEKNTLNRPSALANFSFGQGELMATPVHVAAMTSVIANGGKALRPTVFDSQVNSRLEVISSKRSSDGVQMISEKTAATIKGFMQAAVDYGTAKNGGSQHIDCAAKTGTAETGIFVGDHRVMQAWYTGFFPVDEPEYIVTVLVEDGESGGASAGPVFQYIADALAPKAGA